MLGIVFFLGMLIGAVLGVLSERAAARDRVARENPPTLKSYGRPKEKTMKRIVVVLIAVIVLAAIAQPALAQQYPYQTYDPYYQYQTQPTQPDAGAQFMGNLLGSFGGALLGTVLNGNHRHQRQVQSYPVYPYQIQSYSYPVPTYSYPAPRTICRQYVMPGGHSVYRCDYR